MTDIGNPTYGPSRTALMQEVIKDVVGDTEFDDSFSVCDLADIVNKYHTWRTKLPRIRPFYAVKCNSDPVVLQLMVNLGLGFDCASKGEIENLLKVGAQSTDIVFAHPFKPVGHLRHASSVGVDLMTFDSEEELQKIKDVFPKARLLIRIRIENVKAVYPLNEKFGCQFYNSRWLLSLARKLQLNVVGTSFHVGSFCQEPGAYSRAIKMSKEVFRIAEELGFSFTILDIGGGYPGSPFFYKIFDEMCCCINNALDDYFGDRTDDLQIIAEPGAYFTCSAYSLCTRIIGRKVNDEEKVKQGEPYWMYYLNDSAYGTCVNGFEKKGCKIKPLLSDEEIRKRHTYRSKLWGSSCCSTDCILKNQLLPEIKVGEYLMLDNIGAYTMSLCSNFCGFEKPFIYHVYNPGNEFDKEWRSKSKDFIETEKPRNILWQGNAVIR